MILYTKLNNREVISSGIIWFLGIDKERERFCVYQYRRCHLFSGDFCYGFADKFLLWRFLFESFC